MADTSTPQRFHPRFIMRLNLSIPWVLATAVIGFVGCTAPSALRSSKPVTRDAIVDNAAPKKSDVAKPTAQLAPVHRNVQQDVTQVAQVAHFAHLEDASTDTATCPTDGACAEPMPACAGAGTCSGCQSCNAQPYGYAPYPEGYFNPTLIEPNEFICDGGDNTPHARARVGDQIIGVDLEDTVVRYTTDANDVHVQASNKVCVYAPRFASVRKVTGAESGELAIGPVGILRPEGPVRAQLNQPGLAVTGRNELKRGSVVRGPDAMRARDRSVPVERVLQPELAEDVLPVLANLSLINRGILRDTDKPWLSMAAISAITWSVDTEVGVTVNSLAPVTLTRDLRAEELVVYDFPDAGRLRICKLADKSDALPGELVTFIIRVDNVGDSSVHDIVITDSLVTRLEYVADSQKCTTDAQFATDANDGQSLRLTWKLEKELKVGEGATIEFKCKVR